MKPFPPDSILVPTDLSDASCTALGYARMLHLRFGSGVTVLHAENLEAPPYFTAEQAEALLEAARQARGRALDELEKRTTPHLGFAPRALVVEGVPSQAIIDRCATGGADLVVMATHGRRGFRRLWLGSVTERVLRACPSPVLAVRTPAPAEGIQKILVPVNASLASKASLAYAESMAAALGAELVVLRAGLDAEERVVPGEPVEQILRKIEELAPDVVVMGARGKSGLVGELLGNTTEQILQRVETPLLVVPGLAESGSEKI